MCKKSGFTIIILLLCSFHNTVCATPEINSIKIMASASSIYSSDIASKSIDSSGLDGTRLLHDTDHTNMWLSATGGGGNTNPHSGTESGAAWIKYSFDVVYKLDKMYVWNFNQVYSGTPYTDRGLKKVYIEYSEDGSTWTKLMDDANNYFTFAIGPNEPNYAHVDEIYFNGVEAKYVVITADTNDGNWGGDKYGLSEIRFFGQTIYASIPTPPFGSTSIDANLFLTWTSADIAASHDVYFGTNYNDVNNATTVSSEYKGNQTSSSYDTDSLTMCQSYYWRIDEANSTDVWKGEIWEFWVLSPSIISDCITTSASSIYNSGSDSVKSIDGSGLNQAGLLHDTDYANMWLSATDGGGNTNPHSGTESGAAWIKYSFDVVYKLDKMYVWNFNQVYSGTPYTDRGLKKVYIEYSEDGSTWTKLMDDANNYFTFAIGPNEPNYAHDDTIDFNGIEAKYIVITADTNNGNWGGNKYGLSEIRFFGQTVYASNPTPISGDASVSTCPVLTWNVADIAASHDIYFGSDYNDVNNATTISSEYKGNQTSSSYSPVDLTRGQTYYWRIDEINGSDKWKGDVWEFWVLDSNAMPNWAKKGYGIWTEDSMTQIFTESRPANWPASHSINISLAKREYENFQIAVLPGPSPQGALRNVRLDINDLIGIDDSNNIIESNNIEWYQVGYVYITDARIASKSPYLDSAAPDNGWWPDMLLPTNGYDMTDPCLALPIWVTIYAPPNTPAGNYSSIITLRTDTGEPTEIILKVEVYDFTLPKGAGNCLTAFSLSGTRAFLGSELRSYADFMLKHRLNPDHLYESNTPNVADLEHYYELGMNNFTVINVSPSYYAETSKIDVFFTALSSSSDANDLRDMAIFYGYDEEEPSEALRTRFSGLEANFPDIERMSTATVHRVWGGDDPVSDMNYYYFDYSCPKTSEYIFTESESLRNAGYMQWSYICCSNEEYPHFETNLPVIESRVLWWQMYHQKMDGFLYFSMTNWKGGYEKIYPDNSPLIIDWSYNVTAECNSPGDGELIYPGIDGPIGSIRLANIRDGIEDYEYLYMLEEKAGDVNVVRIFCEPVSWAIHKISSFTYAQNTLQEARNVIADMIVSNRAVLPEPVDEYDYVAIDSSLVWTSGNNASSHNIYIGTNYEDVNSASDPNTLPGRGNQVSNIYDPCGLAAGTTYYWRIDEVNGVNSWKGDVWSFTTRGEISSIRPDSITATAYTNYDSRIAQHTVDKTGLDANGLLDSGDYRYDMWLSDRDANGNPHSGTVSGAAWLEYSFDDTYLLDDIWIWNINQSDQADRGLKNVTIQYSTTGSLWTTLMDDANDYWVFNEADSTTNYAHNTEIDFKGVQVKYIVLTAKNSNGNWGDPNFYGLNEIRFNVYNPQKSIDGNDITSSASSVYSFDMAAKSIDGSGLDETGLLHDTEHAHMWMSDTGGGGETNPHFGTVNGAAWIKYEFDQIYELEDLWIWNMNQLYSGTSYTDRGLKKVTIEYTHDGSNWMTLQDGFNDYFMFYEAHAGPNYQHDTVLNFGGVEVNSVVITADTNDGNWGGNKYGLSELRFFGQPIISGDNITASASSEYGSDIATKSVDSSGLDQTYLLHDADHTHMWMSDIGGGGDINPHSGTESGAAWIKYVFDQSYKLAKMRIWNFNQVYSQTSYADRGLKKVYIEYTNNGSSWTKLMDGTNDYFVLCKAPGELNYIYVDEINFGAVDANAVIITADTDDGNWGGNKYGLSETRFYFHKY